MGMKHHRPSRRVLKSKRWPALRMQALRRDEFRCVQCGERARLEVDHIQPVRDAPELAFDLSNLQTLCARCHTAKTRRDIGLPFDPEREKWKQVLRELPPST